MEEAAVKNVPIGREKRWNFEVVKEFTLYELIVFYSSS